jgi:hypothetical protein
MEVPNDNAAKHFTLGINLDGHGARSLRSPGHARHRHAGFQPVTQAYQACEAITRQHSRTFYLASGLLPAGKRQAVRALYAFCRVSDDIVDRSLTADPCRR